MGWAPTIGFSSCSFAFFIGCLKRDLYVSTRHLEKKMPVSSMFKNMSKDGFVNTAYIVIVTVIVGRVLLWVADTEATVTIEPSSVLPPGILVWLPIMLLHLKHRLEWYMVVLIVLAIIVANGIPPKKCRFLWLPRARQSECLSATKDRLYATTTRDANNWARGEWTNSAESSHAPSREEYIVSVLKCMAIVLVCIGASNLLVPSS